MEQALQHYAEQRWDDAYRAFDAIEGPLARYYAGSARAQLVRLGRPEGLALVDSARRMLEEAHEAGLAEATAELARLHWSLNDLTAALVWAERAGDFYLLSQIHLRNGDLAALEASLAGCGLAAPLLDWSRELTGDLPAARLVLARAAELGDGQNRLQAVDCLLRLQSERQSLSPSLVAACRQVDREGRRLLSQLTGRPFEEGPAPLLDSASRRALLQCPTFCQLRPDLLDLPAVDSHRARANGEGARDGGAFDRGPALATDAREDSRPNAAASPSDQPRDAGPNPCQAWGSATDTVRAHSGQGPVLLDHDGRPLQRSLFTTAPSSIGPLLSADSTPRGASWPGSLLIAVITLALALRFPPLGPLLVFWGGAAAWGYWRIAGSLNHEASFVGEYGVYVASLWGGRVRGRLLSFAEAQRLEETGQAWLFWRDSRGYAQHQRPLFRTANAAFGRAAARAFRTFKLARPW